MRRKFEESPTDPSVAIVPSVENIRNSPDLSLTKEKKRSFRTNIAEHPEERINNRNLKAGGLSCELTHHR